MISFLRHAPVLQHNFHTNIQYREDTLQRGYQKYIYAVLFFSLFVFCIQIKIESRKKRNISTYIYIERERVYGCVCVAKYHPLDTGFGVGDGAGAPVQELEPEVELWPEGQLVHDIDAVAEL
jgi:hypothetical protein